jgi:hypothetical protein
VLFVRSVLFVATPSGPGEVAVLFVRSVLFVAMPSGPGEVRSGSGKDDEKASVGMTAEFGKGRGERVP